MWQIIIDEEKIAGPCESILQLIKVYHIKKLWQKSWIYLFIYLFLKFWKWVMSLFVVVELENDYVPSITPRDAIPCPMLNGMEVRTPPPTTM